MSDIYYTEDHEWIRVEDDEGIVGISDYAQGQLGDVVFVELPKVGKNMIQGKDAAVVESVKAASEVYSPVSGEVIDVNALLEDNPALVNEDAMGDGWFFRIRITDMSELEKLMTQDDYDTYVEGLD